MLLFNSNINQPRNAFQEFTVLLLVFISCMLVFSLIGNLLAFIFMEKNPSDTIVSSILDYDASGIRFIKILDMVLRIGIMGLPAFFAPKFLGINPFKFLNIDKKANGIDLSLFILLFVLMYPFLEWLISFNMKMHLPDFISGIEDWMRNKENLSSNVLNKYLAAENAWGLIFNLMVIALMPAILEELFFRGLLQNFMMRWFNKTHFSVIFTAFIFSVIHFQFFGFLPRFLLGILLGYMLVWTKTLWTPIIFHFLNNSFTVIFVYLSSNGIINSQINDPINMSNLVTVLSFGIAAAFFILLALYFQRKKGKSDDWIMVYSSDQATDSEIIKGSLENEGITAVILNQQVSLYPSAGSIEVMVAPKDVEASKSIISNINLEIIK